MKPLDFDWVELACLASAALQLFVSAWLIVFAHERGKERKRDLARYGRPITMFRRRK